MSNKEIEVKSFTEYITCENDTFDRIALNKYDDEFLASLIIEYNPRYADVIFFDAGTLLVLPEINLVEAERSAPPWRQTDEDDKTDLQKR